MHRTEGTNHSSNLFTDGPPGTVVGANWCNAIQEEIAYVIEQAGLTLLTASTETRQQLLAALNALYTKGVFVNSSDGAPLIDNTQFVVDGIAAGSYRVFGPTGGSDVDETWTALDNVPTDVDWIECRFVSEITRTTGSDGTNQALLRVNVKDYDGSTVSGVDTMVSEITTYGTSTVYGANNDISTVKIPVDNRRFELRYYESGSPDSTSVEMFLTGYGYNPS